MSMYHFFGESILWWLDWFKWSEFEAKWRLSSDQSTQNITWWLGLYLWTWIVAYETHDFIHILQFFTSQFSHRISATDHKESYVYRIQRETNWTVEDVIVRPPRLCLEDRQDISLLIFHAQGFFLGCNLVNKQNMLRLGTYFWRENSKPFKSLHNKNRSQIHAQPNFRIFLVPLHF